MRNEEKLQELLVDVFLLDASEYHIDMKRAEIDTWDSLGVVSMAVGVQETFGHHMTPDEAVGIQSFRDIMNFLRSKGLTFDGA